MRGQALVEMALATPILLLLLVGVFAVGAASVQRMQLVHAAIEAADAGAREPSQPKRCDTALAALAAVYGRNPQDARCVPSVGNAIEVSASDPIAIGGFTWTINVRERAIVP